MAKTYNELINGLSPLEDAIKATKDQKEFDGYKEKFEKLKNDFNDAKDSLGPQKETVQSYIDDVQSAIDSWSKHLLGCHPSATITMTRFEEHQKNIKDITDFSEQGQKKHKENV
ncbi:hypothetical protein B0T17DRAFT_612648 [Bombardia bombarda]|uniref:Uncharacterized protein n=1 Tax=Bombardia bombarda TaxID=252184 RepID=A0AA39XKT9_9PEZI|nr:hypothetical protein B0T17DRAFT_612648 [Bombardia bombarda]